MISLPVFGFVFFGLAVLTVILGITATIVDSCTEPNLYGRYTETKTYRFLWACMLFSFKLSLFWLGVGVVSLLHFSFVTMRSPEYSAKQAEEERAKQVKVVENRTPRLYSRSQNGCEVYTFQDLNERWQYFTTCPNAKTSTQNTWREGKSTKQGTIETNSQ